MLAAVSSDSFSIRRRNSKVAPYDKRNNILRKVHRTDIYYRNRYIYQSDCPFPWNGAPWAWDCCRNVEDQSFRVACGNSRNRRGAAAVPRAGYNTNFDSSAGGNRRNAEGSLSRGWIWIFDRVRDGFGRGVFADPNYPARLLFPRISSVGSSPDYWPG